MLKYTKMDRAEKYLTEIFYDKSKSLNFLKSSLKFAKLSGA